jgi:hypothetical protein
MSNSPPLMARTKPRIRCWPPSSPESPPLRREVCGTPDHPLPFANLEWPWGVRKDHGIRGATGRQGTSTPVAKSSASRVGTELPASPTIRHRCRVHQPVPPTGATTPSTDRSCGSGSRTVARPCRAADRFDAPTRAATEGPAPGRANHRPVPRIQSSLVHRPALSAWTTCILISATARRTRSS